MTGRQHISTRELTKILIVVVSVTCNSTNTTAMILALLIMIRKSVLVRVVGSINCNYADDGDNVFLVQNIRQVIL